MLAIAFVHSGYTEVQTNVLQDVAVNGHLLLVCAEHFLKHGVLAETDMAIAYVIVASI
jgi:hypothetical protein